MVETDEQPNRGLLSRLPFHSLLVLISSLGFIQLGYPLLGKAVILTDVLFLLTAACFGIAILSRKIGLRWDAFFWLVILYLFAITVSTFFSADSKQSLTTFPIEIYLACLSFITFALIDTVRRLKTVVLAWLTGTALAILLSIFTLTLFYTDRSNFLLEYLTYHYGAVPVGNFPRITATFASASMFCNYLNVGLVLAILALYKKWLPTAAAFALIISVLICSVFTVSIGLGGIFLALGLTLTVVYKRDNIDARAFAVAGIVAAASFLIVSVLALAYYPSAEVWTTVAGFRLMPSSRVLVWREAFGIFLKHPITGNGLGLPVANVYFANTEGSTSILTDAHNSFLNVAAQSGLLGLGGLLAITIYLLRNWLERLRSISPITSAIGLAFFCSSVYQGLTGSFEEARHLWVLMGMFVAAYRVETEDQNS